jgi:hypothetical protein
MRGRITAQGTGDMCIEFQLENINLGDLIIEENRSQWLRCLRNKLFSLHWTM